MKKSLKPLSENELQKRKATLKAIEDYFGSKIPEDKFKRIFNAVKSNSTKNLEEEDRKAAWSILMNLDDPLYIGSFKEGKISVA